ncbi:transposase [Desulfolucanica intricata]|uniref:transposase n=1 Tax=Desulfolucanica intricata TaxID=1285191 RepID=UPI0008379A90|nr:transposase [Desulfolucanica intricata]
MGKQKKQYSAEFKQDAVNYYLSSGKSLEQVAGDLKVSKSTLSKWAASAKTNNGTVNHRGSGNYSSDAEKEIARLKKELKDSRDALDILKKAIGILNN